MQSAAKCPILVSFYCKKYEGPDRYFEKKLKFKKEIMKKLTLELNQDVSPPKVDWDLPEDELFSDEEHKAATFMNELVRPMVSRRFVS